MTTSTPNRRLTLKALVALGSLMGMCGSLAHAQHAHAETTAATPTKPGTPARKPRPQLGIGTAFAPNGDLWVVGLDADSKLFVQHTTTATGQPTLWSTPKVVAIGDDPVSADGENRPKLLFGPNNTVLVAYTQPLSKPNTGQVRLVRSVDGGQTFGPPVTVHADRQVITHRFESLAFDAQGLLHTVWIDKRDLEAAPKTNGKASYRGAAIYRNVSTDAGATFGPDIKVADHSCECCRIAMAPGPDGQMRAMWRHVFAPNIRDHAMAVLGTTPMATPPPSLVRATFDDWAVDGCPHHGPALSATAQGFHAVWFGIRAHKDTPMPGVRYARLDGNGNPLANSLQLLPDERAEHADVISQGERVALAWRSIEGSTTTLKAWLSTDGGHNFQLHTLGQVVGPNDFPRLVQHGQRMAVVWRNPAEVRVHELPF